MKYNEMKKIPQNRFKDCIRLLNDVTKRGEREREAGREGETERIREIERAKRKKGCVSFFTCLCDDVKVATYLTDCSTKHG